MPNTSHLNFLQRLFDQLNIRCTVFLEGARYDTVKDPAIQALLRVSDPDYQLWIKRFRESLLPHTVYYVSDEFNYRYVVTLLAAEAPRSILVAGPYTTQEVDTAQIQQFLLSSGTDPRWLPVLGDYFRQVPFLRSEEMVSAFMNAFCEMIWGTTQFSSEYIVKGFPEGWRMLLSSTSADTALHSGTQRLEQSYEAENRMMEIISRGQSHKARVMFSHVSRASLEQRVEPIRNAKNYTIILNTLMRKAAENGGVHPVYIDRLSSEFARRIEKTAQWVDFLDLWSEMAHEYCLMVNRHAIKHYSPLVQKVITRVDFDLTADLSLKTHAASLNANASYLSDLFRKETGQTLTEFVMGRRIDHARFLLASTRLPIAEVARQCGIPDDNYFSKVFKKHTQLTPKQFRARQAITPISGSK